MNDRQKAVPLCDCKSEHQRVVGEKDARIAELEQLVEEACAGRDQWRKTHLKLAAAEKVIEDLKSILFSISEPTWLDDRLSYLDVQISREDYKKLQEYLQKHGVGNNR